MYLEQYKEKNFLEEIFYMKLITMLSLFIMATQALASENKEVWNCSSADKNIQINAIVDSEKATATYNGVELTGANSYWNVISLSGSEDSGRDRYSYELKLLRTSKNNDNQKAVLIFDEMIDCRGTFTGATELTCTIE
jgi:hypothetical protein